MAVHQVGTSQHQWANNEIRSDSATNAVMVRHEVS